ELGGSIDAGADRPTAEKPAASHARFGTIRSIIGCHGETAPLVSRTLTLGWAVYSMQQPADRRRLAFVPTPIDPGGLQHEANAMRRILVPALLTLLIGARGALALEAHGTLKKVDAENGTMVVFANGQDRNLRIAPDVTVSGVDGKPLPGGIKAGELK